MQALRTAISRLRREQRGFTLPELLVASVLGLLVIGSATSVFTAGIRSEPRVSDRAARIQQARAFAEDVSRELRQGWGTPIATSSQLAILTYVRRTTCGGSTVGASIPCRVTYSCTAGACTRVVANPNGSGSGPAVRVVEGLADTNVFSYAPTGSAPTYLGIRIPFPAEGGDDAITIEDGVAFRNITPPTPPAA